MVPIFLIVLTLAGGLAFVACWRRLMLRFDAGIPQAALSSAWRRLCPARQRSWYDLEHRALAKMRSLVVVAVTGRAVVPARYDVYLAPEDLARMAEARAFLENDLGSAIRSEALQQGWHMMHERVEVRFHEEEAAVVGLPRVVSSFARPAEGNDCSQPSQSAAVSTLPLATEVETDTAVTEGDGLKDVASGWCAWRLVPTSDAYPQLELRDRVGPLTVGRSAGLDLRLAHPTVSGLHARLWRTSAGWQLEDAGSRNGTYVDDRRQEQLVDLADGMVLAFSRTGPRYRVSMASRHAAETELGDPR